LSEYDAQLRRAAEGADDLVARAERMERLLAMLTALEGGDEQVAGAGVADDGDTEIDPEALALVAALKDDTE